MSLITYTQDGEKIFRSVDQTTNLTIVSTAVDARSVGETHILKPGLLLGVITASDKLSDYSNANTDGTESAVYVLMDEIDMKGGNPLDSVADRVGHVLVSGTVAQVGLGGYDAAAKADLTPRKIFVQA